MIFRQPEKAAFFCEPRQYRAHRQTAVTAEPPRTLRGATFFRLPNFRLPAPPPPTPKPRTQHNFRLPEFWRPHPKSHHRNRQHRPHSTEYAATAEPPPRTPRISGCLKFSTTNNTAITTDTAKKKPPHRICCHRHRKTAPTEPPPPPRTRRNRTEIVAAAYAAQPFSGCYLHRFLLNI